MRTISEKNIKKKNDLNPHHCLSPKFIKKEIQMFLVNFLIYFNIIFRSYISFYMIIPDCDETYNYWEPLNFMLRGFGKQTWEYSPSYGIRSYAYLMPYYLVGHVIKTIINFFHNKNRIFSYSVYQFYFIRLIALNGFTSFSEIFLFESLKKNVNYKIACIFLFLSTISTGMSHAGVAFLPSSFSMQCNMIALSYLFYYIHNKNINNSVKAITWFSVGSILGWPFSIVLSIPFALYVLYNECFYKKKEEKNNILTFIIKSIMTILQIVIVVVLIDSYYYNKILFPSFNIVKYNIFSNKDEGPNIFGTEDYKYYIFNLLLNFNFISILSYLNVLLSFFIYKFKGIFFLLSLPLLMWTIIFIIQPHKEERFLYPIYPFVTLNCAFLMYKLMNFFKSNKFFKIKIIRQFTKIIFSAFLISVSIISISKTIKLIQNYSAPLEVFKIYNNIIHDKLLDNLNICIGREWHRFPTSFFLPDNVRLRYIKTLYDGILPGDFNESFKRIKDTTSMIPANMNNKNKFENDKVVNFDICDYYVDNTLQQTINDGPSIIKWSDNNNFFVQKDWKIISCHNISNTNDKKKHISDLIYIPKKLAKFFATDKQELKLCILQKIKKDES